MPKKRTKFMVKLLAAALAAVFTLSQGTSIFALSPGKPATSKEVQFTDDAFESMVRDALDKTTGAVTQADMETLYADIHDMEIQRLLFDTGLDVFTYNRLLYIINGKIVRNGAEIKAARASAGKNEDIAELSIDDMALVTDVQLLFFESVSVQDLEPVLDLEELVYLSLTDCDVPDDQIAAIEGAGIEVAVKGGEGFVTFSSPEFEAMVRKALDKTSGGITTEELRGLCIQYEGKTVLCIALGYILADDDIDSAIASLEDEILEMIFEKTGVADEDEFIEKYGDKVESELERFLATMSPELDLTDVALFGDIEGLAMTFVTIPDFSPLADVPSLEIIALEYVVCGDISLALSLPNLEAFSGGFLYMTDDGWELKPETSESLTEITLTNTEITDFSGLSVFPNLTDIDLSGNHITDIETLNWLYDLEDLSSVNLSYTFLPWALLENMDDALESFPIYYNTLYAEFADKAFEEAVRDMLGITDGDIDVDYLDQLFADDDFIEEIMNSSMWTYNYNLMFFLGEIIRDWDEFEVVYDAYAEKSEGLDEDELLTVPMNTANLAYMPDLSGAIVLAAEVDDITPLLDLTGLDALYFEASIVPDLSRLFELPNLSTLTFINCQLAGDVWAVSKPEKSWVDSLTISSCGLADIKPLQYMPYLFELDISYNEISDITPLLKMTDLEYLNISGNPISDEDIERLKKALPDTEIVTGNEIGFATGVNMVVFENEAFEQMVLDALGKDQGPVSSEELTSLYIDEDFLREYMGLNEDAFSMGERALLIMGSQIVTNADQFEEIMNTMDEMFFDEADPFSIISQAPALSLDGIDVFADCEELYILFSRIDDLSPIKELPKLKEFLAAYIGLEDFSPAFEIAGLRTILAGAVYGSDKDAEVAVFPKNITSTELEYLTLYDMHIGDISALQKMKGLNELELESNRISDITPLTDMTELERLNIADNQISDITPLLGMTNLQILYVDDNCISDDDLELLEESLPDAYITKERQREQDSFLDEDFTAMVQAALGTDDDIQKDMLQELYCDMDDDLFWEIIDYQEMSGEDISHMLVIVGDIIVRNYEEFSMATAKLEDSGFEMTTIDMKNLLAFEDMDFLFIYGCSALNADVLLELQYLKAINMAYGEITDVAALFSIPKLSHLLLESVTVTYDAPRHTPGESSLEWLYCYYVEGLESLPHFDKLTNLKYLAMLYCEIMDIKQLKSLTQLEYLVLNGNSVADITPLTGMKGLVFLSLSSNIITDFTPLAELDNLVTLLLDYSYITSLDFIEGMNKLEELSLYSNNISDISPLLELENLIYLDLEENNVSEEDYEKLTEHFPECDIWWY